MSKSIDDLVELSTNECGNNLNSMCLFSCANVNSWDWGCGIGRRVLLAE